MNAEALVRCLLDAEGDYTPDGYRLLASTTAGDYELKLWAGQGHVQGAVHKFAELSLNRAGLSFDPASQGQKFTGSTGALGHRHDLLTTVAQWLKEYGPIFVGSHSLQKLAFYHRILRRYLPRLKISEPYAAFDESEGVADYFRIEPPVGQTLESLLELSEASAQSLTLYHLTWDVNVPSIMQHGIVPSYAPSKWRVSSAAARSKGKTFLCNKRRIDYWWMTYSEGWVTPPTPDAELVVLKVVVPKSWVKPDVDTEPVEEDEPEDYTGDFVLKRTIPTSCIKGIDTGQMDREKAEALKQQQFHSGYRAESVDDPLDGIEPSSYVDALPSYMNRMKAEAIRYYDELDAKGLVNKENRNEMADVAATHIVDKFHQVVGDQDTPLSDEAARDFAALVGYLVVYAHSLY